MRLDKFLLLAILTTSVNCYAGKVMIVRFHSEDMDTVSKVVANDLKKHEIVEFIMKKETDFDEFRDSVRKNKPDFLALLDNKAVTFMSKLREQKQADALTIPAAATMALNLKQRLKDSKDVCGIAFEVPAFTVVTRFRSLVKKPILTVLAPYRKSEFESLIAEAKNQLEKEGIKLIGVDLESEGTDPKDINKRAASVLSDSYEGTKIDAILVPSDNLILNKDGFKIWLAKARDLKLPFLCNIDKFASKDFDFCTFAAYPDFSDLGHQFSEQILEILNNGATAGELGVDYIVSAKASLNAAKAASLNLPLHEEKLISVKLVK